MESKQILKKPIISEKSLSDATDGNYTFEVDQKASKIEIRQAFKEVFGVEATKIRTLTTKGRTSRIWGRRGRADVGPIKKAVVTLKKGQKLDVFEVKADK
jgi:large subunit ribosomal protein L23